MLIKGKVHKYGDNIDTDVIIPARYCTSYVEEELAPHCLEDLDADFARKVAKGDILVAGQNFGCGSSRENAPLAIKGAGVSLVIAKSFARIFYRNSINIGLPILEAPEAVENVDNGDLLEVDIRAGKIRNLRTNQEFQSNPFPDQIEAIIKAGGILNYIKTRTANA